MSRAKTFESGPQDVEQPLLTAEDAAFDELPAEAGTAADALRSLAAARARGRLAHALLLAGPRGSGKRWVATRLAQLLACLSPLAPRGGVGAGAGGVGAGAGGVGAGGARPCLRCAECLRTERGLDPDVQLLQPPWDDKKGERKGEIPVEQVRRAQDLLGYRATAGRRVVIVDPADRLSIIAQEALLKTLEEPPAGVTLLLLTSRPSFLKPTIRSRAPMLRVRPPSAEALGALLAARRSMSPADAELAARLSGGDVVAALRAEEGAAGERWVATARTLYEILGSRGERRARDLAVAVVPAKGEEGGGGGREEIASFLTLLSRILRDALIAGEHGDAAGSRLLNPDAAKAAHALAQRLPPQRAALALAAVETAREDLALSMNAKIVLTHLLLSLHGLRAA